MPRRAAGASLILRMGKPGDKALHETCFPCHMSTATIPSPIHHEPALLGQTVVVIGGSSGIGFETACRASAEVAKVILTARDPELLKHAANKVGASSTAAFDATDPLPSSGSFVTCQ
jgi:threonine dehydrogenase-like Zn-dependent dehydrogenase